MIFCNDHPCTAVGFTGPGLEKCVFSPRPSYPHPPLRTYECERVGDVLIRAETDGKK